MKSHNQKSTNSANPVKGYSLIEVLVVTGIVMLLAATALPSFNDAFERRKLDVVMDEFASSAIVVRSAAIKAGSPVVLCASSDGMACSTDWGDGWLAFNDVNQDDVQDADEPIVLRRANDSGSQVINVTSIGGTALNSVTFNYRGAPDTSLQVTITRGDISESMSISPFGKPRTYE